MKNFKFRFKHDLGRTGPRKEQSHPLIPEHLLSCSCSRRPLVTDSLTVRVVKASLVLRAGHLSFPDNLTCISPEWGVLMASDEVSDGPQCVYCRDSDQI